jgi:hypothetical protein
LPSNAFLPPQWFPDFALVGCCLSIVDSLMGVIMDTIELYRAQADDCLRRADSDTNENDKPLWVTLAQSWLQLAEDADRISSDARTAKLERAVADALI